MVDTAGDLPMHERRRMSHADTYGEGGCATREEMERERKKDYPYSVNHWCSHPDENNDDCMTGSDFATREEAIAFYNKPGSRHVKYIEMDGPDGYSIRENENYVAPTPAEIRAEEDEWRREIAMEAGMCMGIDAYNEVMGYD